ncbi:MAG: GDSL-type esterase/lipase family protein [Bifidobacteriaceae bacterium]|nr:GDSL-type esterase/lipase family protein [Bifidobacteriaceae bacterium]
MALNLVHQARVLAEAWKAKRTIVLAKEPDGDRFGTVEPSQDCAAAANVAGLPPLRFLAVGDSMAAACGTSSQQRGLIPQFCSLLADATGRSIAWRTDGRLGATLRRVRYRQLPAVDGQWDCLIICAGSNDIMANRAPDSQWIQELRESLGMARQHAHRVIIFPAGQLYSIPALGPALADDLKRKVFAQAEAVKKVCEPMEDVTYLEWTHGIPFGEMKWFWCSDCFHPSYEGYGVISHFLMDKMTADDIADLSGWCEPDKSDAD